MKKVFLFGGVLAFVFAGLFAIWLIMQKKEVSTDMPTQFLAKNSLLSVRRQDNQNFLTYKKDGFIEIDYPDLWEAVPGIFGNGEEVAVRPKNMDVGDFIPSVYVLRFNTNGRNLLVSQREQYDKIHYSESQVKVSGINAIYLSGFYPFYTKKGQIIEEPLVDGVYFIIRNDSLIEIRTRYIGSQKDKNFEDLLKRIIDSIRLI